MALLTSQEVEAALRELPGWSLRGKALEREFSFADFAAAIAFVNRVAEIAEQMNHHPDIDIRYNKVRVATWSHDKGGVTKRDVKLAGALQQA